MDLQESLEYLKGAGALIQKYLTEISAALAEQGISVVEPLKVTDIAGYIDAIGQ